MQGRLFAGKRFRRRRGDCLRRGDPYLARRTPAADCSRRFMADIDSPCNKVCTVDPISALCLGCGRSLAEIEGWVGFSADERARVMAQLPQRLASLDQARAARALLP
jgi:predicted Fe-S protein YdhL (DUF1289 family)